MHLWLSRKVDILQRLIPHSRPTYLSVTYRGSILLDDYSHCIFEPFESETDKLHFS